MDATSPSTIVSSCLPIVHGHIAKKWGWLGRRGHCLVTVEDLQQVAAIALVELADKWEGIVDRSGKPKDEDLGGLFWWYLKDDIKHRVIKYVERSAHMQRETGTESLSPEDGLEESPASVRTSLSRRTSEFSLLQDELVDYFTVMPTADKIIVALRVFDELSYGRVADLLEIGPSAAKQRMHRVVTRWRTFARNQCVDEPIELPTRRVSEQWEAPATLTRYMDARYRTDLAGYLGYFTTCLRHDVSYLVDILGPVAFVPPSLIGHQSSLTEGQRAEVQFRLEAGESRASIARAMDVDYQVVGRQARRRAAA